jgi:hypothetical protein
MDSSDHRPHFLKQIRGEPMSNIVLKEQLKNSIDYLQGVSNGTIRPEKLAWGICDNLWNFVYKESGSCRLEGLETLLDDSFKSWPDFSGSLMFPVPAPDNMWGAGAYYGYFQDRTDGTNNMYDKRTAYGKSRHRLILHVLKEFKKKLEELQS